MKIAEKDKLRFYYGRDPHNKGTRDFVVHFPQMQMGSADAGYLFTNVFTDKVMEELARRGYDLTTIRFSIAPKLENPTRPERFQKLIEKYRRESTNDKVVDFTPYSREEVAEIDKRIEEKQRKYDAELRDKMMKAKDFPMTD